MKKAKIILTLLAILAAIGGVLAFKASKFIPPNIWTIVGTKSTTITHPGAPGVVFSTIIPNCTTTDKATTNIGPLVVVTTSSTRADVTTIFQAGTLQYVTTYIFCTTILTRTTIAN